MYASTDFSIRFSEAAAASFANTVIGLSTLQKYDHLPFVVCVVRPSGVQLLLANSTLIDKVSHSSHELRIDNVRGSILGTNIVRTLTGLANTPQNFDALFTVHQEFTWGENLARLVEATSAIAGTGTIYLPNEVEIRHILGAPELAIRVAQDVEYVANLKRLTDLVLTGRQEILAAALIDNVNLRGNRIEQIITNAGNLHALEDITIGLAAGFDIKIDVKSKLLEKPSAPKLYNIDKMLRLLATGRSVFAVMFVGIEPKRGMVLPQIVSIFDESIIDATRVQFHWAGRNSRGVTQLTGDFSNIFSAMFRESIDITKAKQFLQGLIDCQG